MSAPERKEQRMSQQEDVIEEGVRKQTRRISSYWCWFREIGCKKFRHMHGHDYDENCVEDRKLVTELWDLDKESWSVVEQHGTPSAPSHKGRSDQKFPKALLGLILSTASQKYQVTRPIYLGHFPCFELQFVLINPFIVAPSVKDGILVYPAEISITHFTFERGTISCWSSLINFDPNILDATRHRFHQSTVEENVSHEDSGKGGVRASRPTELVSTHRGVEAMFLGVPVKSAQGRYPCEVWRTFVTKCHNHGTVVCDADQMEILDGALYFLASTVGPHQLQIHAEIMDKMITIQDFISALGCVYYDVIEKRLPRYLTDESIDRQFTNAKQVNEISL
ncbi:unnamed protein product [Angiostrongylus costaricensis]|uniref:DUF3694 domain-containing protein n=1 Tax=Angiostrongylus costaricensis TaxID=334426 RepID=A0A0R3PHA8_ANGCS|nr:unnamed protein product [Angiostrongylus costaricensis]